MSCQKLMSVKFYVGSYANIVQPFQYIDSQLAFDESCAKAMDCKYVALDTEFVRTSTYYPKLGLIQMFDGEQLSLIDALCIDNWDAFSALLLNRNVVKVLHSCSEDLEVFWHNVNVMPTPLFDSQLAAGIAGRGGSVGYAKLVSDLLQIELDKGESRTDWLQRPLSDKQLEYAANDVTYLYQIYPMLLAELGDRSEWVFSDTEQMMLKKQRPLPAEFHYLSVKNNWQLRGRSLAALKALAQWRMDTAKQSDLALNFVVRETAILEIARHLPKDKRSLANLRCLSGKELRKHGATILDILTRIQQLEPSQFPNKVERLSELPFYKKVLHAARQICLTVAEEQSIKPEVFASKNQVNQVLKMHWFDTNESDITGITPDLATGWRGELVYDKLIALLKETSKR